MRGPMPSSATCNRARDDLVARLVDAGLAVVSPAALVVEFADGLVPLAGCFLFLLKRRFGRSDFPSICSTASAGVLIEIYLSIVVPLCTLASRPAALAASADRTLLFILVRPLARWAVLLAKVERPRCRWRWASPAAACFCSASWRAMSDRPLGTTTCRPCF